MKAEFWIPGPPEVLFLDLSENSSGWESEMARRICDVTRRHKVAVSGVHKVQTEQEMVKLINDNATANCIFITACESPGDEGLLSIKAIEHAMAENNAKGQRITAVYLSYTPTRRELIGPTEPGLFGRVTILNRPELTQKEAALFFPEFFSELSSHCPEAISAHMIRFCFAKANRFAPGKVSLLMQE